MGFRVQGLGFRVLGLPLRESVVLGIRVSSLGFRIESLVCFLELEPLGLLKGFWGQMGFRFKGWGFRLIEAFGAEGEDLEFRRFGGLYTFRPIGTAKNCFGQFYTDAPFKLP